MKNLSKIILAAGLVVFASCEPEFDNPVDDAVITSGDADFSKYVSIGNSLTSGFTDNALFINGQENSYPNMLAGRMAQAGGGSFTQPLMPDNIGGFTNLGVSGKLVLMLDPESGSMGPVATPAESPLTPASGGPFNNMGVPGAKSYHLVAPGYGDPAGIGSYANPYFVRFASSPTTTVLSDAAAQQPTFFTLWIGNNDVLSYATGGGVGVDQDAANNMNPTTYGGEDISHRNVVGGVIQTVLETMVNTVGAKGAIANIPSITDIPYFTTVPYAPLDPSNASFGSMIPALNEFYGLLNAVYDYLGASDRKVNFYTDKASPVVIQDKTLTDLSTQIRDVMMAQGVPAAQATLMGMTYGQTRQANENDLLVFTSQTIIGQLDMARVGYLMSLGLSQEEAALLSVSGLTYPLEDKWVLIPSEIQAVQSATAAYNAIIESLANQYELALVDAHSAMEFLNSDSGLVYYGNSYSATYVSGGAFSLDAVHPTGKGYAIIANYFTRAINKKYGSTLREVNPNDYPGVVIP